MEKDKKLAANKKKKKSSSFTLSPVSPLFQILYDFYIFSFDFYYCYNCRIVIFFNDYGFIGNNCQIMIKVHRKV